MKERILKIVLAIITIIVLFITGSYVLKKNYYFNISEPFKCTLDYLVQNTDKKELAEFAKLEGADIYYEWDNLTVHLAENNHVLEDCGLYKYMYENEIHMDSLKGGMIFIYYMHSYLKDGYVDEEKVKDEIDEFIQNRK